MRSPRRYGRLFLAAALVLVGAAHRNALPAPDVLIELAATARDIDGLRRNAAALSRAVPLPSEVVSSLEPCGVELRLRGACQGPAHSAAARIERCRQGLVRATAAALNRLPAGSSLRTLAAQSFAQQAAALAFRLRRIGASVSAACTRATAAGEIPVEATIERSGHGLFISPSRPLVPGKRYALIVRGEQPPGKPELVPKPTQYGVTIPEGAVVGRLPDELRRTSRVVTFVRRVEDDARHLPGIGPRGVLLVQWKGEVAPENLLALEPIFIPMTEQQVEPPAETVAVFRVMPVAERLSAYRAALDRLSCPPPHLTTVRLHARRGREVRRALAATLRGRFRSLDIRGGEGEEALFGRDAAAARPVYLDFLLALPKATAARHGPWPVVIMAHGLNGSGEGFLSEHAEGLAEHGLAAASIDLPDQGRRARPGVAFVDPLDPRKLALNLRQAAVDLLAFSRHLARCPLGLPPKAALARRAPLFFGYSLGSMIGVVLRAIEPLGTTVLTGSGGDLGGWLIFWIAKELGLPPLVCVGGPREGASCKRSAGCPAPGACVPNPYLVAMLRSVSVAYPLLLAPGEPLSFAPAAALHGGPLLLQAGSRDATIFPMLTEQLAVAMGLPRNPPEMPRSRRLYWVWDGEGHGLIHSRAVRRQAYAFLASGGSRLDGSAR